MNIQKCQTLVAIVGPTGVGKTAYAIEAAKKFNAELLSVDSRQLYTGMDIATGKEADLGSWEVVNGRKTLNIEGISLHGLDVVRPNESFSINDWHILASQLIKEIISRGKHPLLVGGTGFYLDSLQGNIDTMMVPPNQQLRENLQSLSNEELIKQLELLDRDKASNIDIHNKRKIIRAIEVAQFESATPIDKNKQSEHSVRYNLVLIGLTMNRDVLYQKIDARV